MLDFFLEPIMNSQEDGAISAHLDATDPPVQRVKLWQAESCDAHRMDWRLLSAKMEAARLLASLFDMLPNQWFVLMHRGWNGVEFQLTMQTVVYEGVQWIGFLSFVRFAPRPVPVAQPHLKAVKISSSGTATICPASHPGMCGPTSPQTDAGQPSSCPSSGQEGR